MTTELADGIWQLTPLPGVNTWAIRDDDGVTLVDAAMRQSVPRLVRQLRGLGIERGDVRRILLTHGHIDHLGGVAPLRRTGVDATVQAGEADLPYVRTGTPPESDESTRSGRLFNRLPWWLSPPDPEGVDDATAVPEHEVLPIGGGLIPVPTPGHTPGHTAFHLPAHGLVLGGDVVFNVFRLIPSPAFVCSSVPANRSSIATVAGLEPRTLALAHGAPVTDDVAGRLMQLVADAEEG